MGGEADHKKTAAICESANVPYIIANGGIETVRDAWLVKEMSGCDGIMVGRAALRDPLIFSEIRQSSRDEVGNGRPHLGDIIIEHFNGFHSLYGEKATTFFKKHLSWYTRDLPDAAGFRRRISEVTDPEVMKCEIEGFFKKNR
jgi:tRNA-dihydrouridine synthase B